MTYEEKAECVIRSDTRIGGAQGRTVDEHIARRRGQRACDAVELAREVDLASET